MGKVILIGPPNFGSIFGLQKVMKGLRTGLGKIPTEVFATTPSAFQLMPNPGRDWMIDIRGDRFERSLYDVEMWREYRCAIFHPRVRARVTRRRGPDYYRALVRMFSYNLGRGKRFHLALEKPYADTPVRYLVFGGDCTLTPTRCLVETIGDNTYLRLHPREIKAPRPGVDYGRLMLEPGDGKVTKPSSLARSSLAPTFTRGGALPLAYSLFLCEKHSRLTGNISFQGNLLNVLLLRNTAEDRM